MLLLSILELAIESLYQLLDFRTLLFEVLIRVGRRVNLRFEFLLFANDLQNNLVEAGFLLNKRQYLLFAVVYLAFGNLIAYFQDD